MASETTFGHWKVVFKWVKSENNGLISKEAWRNISTIAFSIGTHWTGRFGISQPIRTFFTFCVFRPTVHWSSWNTSFGVMKYRICCIVILFLTRGSPSFYILQWYHIRLNFRNIAFVLCATFRVCLPAIDQRVQSWCHPVAITARGSCIVGSKE